MYSTVLFFSLGAHWLRSRKWAPGEGKYEDGIHRFSGSFLSPCAGPRGCSVWSHGGLRCARSEVSRSPQPPSPVLQVRAPVHREDRCPCRALFCCDSKNSPKLGHHIPSLTGTTPLTTKAPSNTCSSLHTPLMPREGQAWMVTLVISCGQQWKKSQSPWLCSTPTALWITGLRGFRDSWGIPSASDRALSVPADFPILYGNHLPSPSPLFKKSFKFLVQPWPLSYTARGSPFLSSFFLKCGHHEVLRGRGIKQINSDRHLEMEATVCSHVCPSDNLN